MNGVVLLVDDEAFFAEAARDYLAADGIEVRVAHTLADAKLAVSSDIDVYVLDQRLPDGQGAELLSSIRPQESLSEIIFISAHPADSDAAQALRDGVVDYLPKPFDLEQLRLATLRSLRSVAAARALSAQRRHRTGRDDQFAGSSDAIAKTLDLARRAANADVPLLVTGETGTGKTHLARFAHECSQRARQSLVAVNCAAIPSNLLEAELFGAERGAYTGANEARAGLFEVAKGGTLLLDEVGEIPLAAQGTLLAVLDDRKLRRLGSTRTIATDVRVIAATNVDLEKAVAAGTFRRDLFFRLNVVRVDVPPLRRRKEDLPELVDSLLRRLAPGRPASLADGELVRLAQYRWPGNVRELRSVLERSLILDPIRALRPSSALASSTSGITLPPPPQSPRDVMRSLAEVEREHILGVLAAVDGRKQRAAEVLQIGVATLRRKLKEYGEPDDDGDRSQ